MKELITGFILFAIIILIAWSVRGDVKPDLSNDQEYAPCFENGHPLWTDC